MANRGVLVQIALTKVGVLKLCGKNTSRSHSIREYGRDVDEAFKNGNADRGSCFLDR
jgi:hypothetical protein